MAKGIGLFGNFSGKLGNVVGFTLKNASTKATQGLRTYAPTVANPKTELQATQRMKMVAATNFYRPLVEILNNAWQGQKYGTRSRQYFMKLAMSQAEGIPFIDKGDKHFYPGQFAVSQGSLPTQTILQITDHAVGAENVGVGTAITSLNIGAEYDFSLDTVTWGEFSQALINNTFGVLNGDKITFIAVGVKNGEYTPIYSYAIVNTESDALLRAEVMAASNMQIFVQGGNLELGFSQFEKLAAAAIIISRYPQGSSTWLRSNSVMVVSDEYKASMMSGSRYDAAVVTYMGSSGSLSSNWYLNRGLTEGDVLENWGGTDSNISVVSYGTMSATLVYDADQASTTNFTNIAVAVMSDGSKRVVTVTDAVEGVLVAAASGSSYRPAETMVSGYGKWAKADAANLQRLKQADSAVAGWYNSGVSTEWSPEIDNRP